MMSEEKVVSAATTIRANLVNYWRNNFPLGIPEPKRLVGDERWVYLGWHRLVPHALFMCDEIVVLIRDGRREKAMRWLGFLQCLALTLGALDTLDDMKKLNMPTPEEEAAEEQLKLKFKEITDGCTTVTTEVTFPALPFRKENYDE